tara:strand:+ start:812 stop:1300 length:489 start_codon:yes stop_codon:yes gene_type:complete
MEQYLYFREVTTTGADDDFNASMAIPVSALIGMYPIGNSDGAAGTDDDTMSIRFNPVTINKLKVNTHWVPEATALGAKDVVYSRHIKHENGKVELTIVDNKFREVMEAISTAISSGKNFIVVADNVKGEFVSPHIVNCVNLEPAYDTGTNDSTEIHAIVATT